MNSKYKVGEFLLFEAKTMIKTGRLYMIANGNVFTICGKEGHKGPFTNTYTSTT